MKEGYLVQLNSVRLVFLQFTFSNPKIVPLFVRRIEPKTLAEEIEHKNQIPGRQIIEPIANVSLQFFPFYLEANGYQLTDAFYQTRFKEKDNRPYHMVRFLFYQQQNLRISSEEFRQIQSLLRAELQELSNTALWQVKAFLNPFFENGQEVPGQYALSINLAARRPFFEPNYFLCINDNAVFLIRNEGVS